MKAKNSLTLATLLLISFCVSDAHSTTWMTLKNDNRLSSISVIAVLKDSIEIQSNGALMWLSIDSIQLVGRTRGSKAVGGIIGGVIGLLVGGIVGGTTGHSAGEGDFSFIGNTLLGAGIGTIVGAVAGVAVVPGDESYNFSSLSHDEKIEILRSLKE